MHITQLFMAVGLINGAKMRYWLRVNPSAIAAIHRQSTYVCVPWISNRQSTVMISQPYSNKTFM